MKNVHSSTVENYIKQIYLESQRSPKSWVTMKNLATKVGVSPGTATSMVKNLAKADLINYEPRGGSKLKPAGVQLALNVLRRHRLIELFLVKILQLDWSEVHKEAELLEHAISDKVLEKLDKFMGRPSFDPHGDPIPTTQGEIEEGRHNSLAQYKKGEKLRVARIIDQHPKFLKFAERKGLIPGAELIISDIDLEADSLTLIVNKLESNTQSQVINPLTLSTFAATKMLVEKI